MLKGIFGKTNDVGAGSGLLPPAVPCFRSDYQNVWTHRIKNDPYVISRNETVELVECSGVQ